MLEVLKWHCQNRKMNDTKKKIPYIVDIVYLWKMTTLYDKSQKQKLQFLDGTFLFLFYVE